MFKSEKEGSFPNDLSVRVRRIDTLTYRHDIKGKEEFYLNFIYTILFLFNNTCLIQFEMSSIAIIYVKINLANIMNS